MTSNTWQPSVSQEMLKARAHLLEKIREFMSAQGVLEVETPVLVNAAVSEPNIDSFETTFQHPGEPDKQNLYLHTSPEYAMKRLLASGSGPIYQICHVFRNDEAGKLHNPEFTMLEWYRPGYDHHQLMDELDKLLISLSFKPAIKTTYADVFKEKAGINPHIAELKELQRVAAVNGLTSNINDKATLLDFIFSHCVSDHLGHESPIMIYDYPACQAALARITDTKPQVAERFELFINGMEIANGFHELCDADEQKKRFIQDNLKRKQSGKCEIGMDQRFLDALEHGLPPSTGVAVGVDRLLMAMYDCKNIHDVIAFPIDRA
jgi:lysyl-tRNA synthetase class 2